MKMYKVYVCEKCGKESKNQDDIELCEAIHMGLNTLEEKREYDSLCSSMRDACWVVTNNNNEETNKQCDEAIVKVIAFEKEHNMTIER